MIMVFGSFLLGGQRVLAEFGFGLAFSVLVDALVIRSMLVPAMHLIGPANWAMPAWLDRILPNLSVEAADLAQLPTEETPGPGPSGCWRRTRTCRRGWLFLTRRALAKPAGGGEARHVQALAADGSAIGTAHVGSESHCGQLAGVR